MTVRAKHTFVSAKADSGDATLVEPSDWNADHSLHLTGPALVGRGITGDGPSFEVTLGQGLAFSSNTLLVPYTSFINVVTAGNPTTTVATAANLEANVNATGISAPVVVPPNSVCTFQANLGFTTAATTTGVSLGVNASVETGGNITLCAGVCLPVTNAAAATTVERFRSVSSTTAGTTIGVAILNTASTTDQGASVTGSLVNRSATASSTLRIVYGTEVSGSAVTCVPGSTVLYTIGRLP